jgi:drug/metabolite transporter (DMT)-like permease
MQKMSLIVSVPFAIWAFQESVTGLKIAGIALALAAVVMTNIPAQAQNSTAAADTPARPMWLWIFPIYAFVNSGTIECILQYTQGKIINTMPEAATEGAAFTMASFGWAGLLGGIVMLGGMALGKLKLTMRTVVASIVLGIPNYFSIFFLLRALNWQDKSVILPTNNIAIVAISVLTGYFLFRERLSIINVAGVVLAIGAILLLAF